MNSKTPLVCNMGVFTPIQREAHIQTTVELIQSVQSVRGVENGYEFRFSNESTLISKIADFISGERLCCPFLEFRLTVSSNQQPITLSLTGPIGTPAFLREEFAGAIP